MTEYSIPDFDLIRRNNAFFCLASGRRFNPFNARPEDIHLDDIATGLSNIRRFGGQTVDHMTYTVAEHCILVSRLVGYMISGEHDSEIVQRQALLHDASEALGFNDIISPVKRCLPDYVREEQSFMAKVYRRFGLPTDEYYSVKLADQWALSAEQLIFQPDVPWLREAIAERKHEPLPDGIRIMGWEPEYAECRFLDRCFELDIR